MTPLQARVKAVVERLGDSFTVGATSGKALVSVLTADQAQTVLTAAEIGAAAMPIRAFHVPFDDATAVGASLTWNGTVLTVKRALDVRLRDLAVFRLLIAI